MYFKRKINIFFQLSWMKIALVYLWHLLTNGSKHLQAGYIKFSEWKGWDTCTYIYGFNPAQCVCLFNAKTWWFVCVRWIGVCCSFCLYCWNCLSYFLKWLFLKAVKHEINLFYQWSDCHFLADIQTPLVWTCTIYIPLMSPVHINYSSYKKKQQKNGKQILRIKLLLVQNKQQKNGKQILRTKLLLVQNKQQKNGKQILRTSHSTLLHGKRNARCNHQCELKHFNSCSER